MLTKRMTSGISGMVLVGLIMAACSSSPSTSGSGTTTTTKSGVSSTTAATAAKGNGKDPSDPIPLGQTGSVEGWTVKVISVVPETTDPVTSTTAAGYESLVYTMEATREQGQKPAPPIVLAPQFLASNHLTYNAASQPFCNGGQPMNNDVYPGGTATHSACITVPSTAASHLVLGMGIVNKLWFATS